MDLCCQQHDSQFTDLETVIDKLNVYYSGIHDINFYYCMGEN